MKGGQCFSKALLENCCQKLGLDYLQVYKRYLSKLCHPDLPQIFDEEDTARELYMVDSPETPPFMMNCSSTGHLTSIQRCLSYMSGKKVSIALFIKKESMMNTIDRIFYNGDSERVLNGQNPAKEDEEIILPFYVTVTNYSNTSKNKRNSGEDFVLESVENVSRSELTSPPQFCNPLSTVAINNGCILKSLVKLLEEDEDNWNDLVPSAYKCFMDLVEDPMIIDEMIGAPVLFVVHEGVELTRDIKRHSRELEAQRFSFLGIVGTRMPIQDLESLDDVAIIGATSTHLYLLPQEYEIKLKSDLRSVNKTKQNCFKPESLTGSSQRDQEEVDDSFSERAEGESEKRNFPCSCELCQDDESTRQLNMSQDGPQRQYVTQLDAFQLLHILGLDSKENIDAVKKACDLSLSAYDIESSTKYLEDDGEASLLEEPLTYTRPCSKVVATQEAALIGYTDALESECTISQDIFQDAAKNFKVFIPNEECSNDHRQMSVRKMVEQFYSHVLDRIELLRRSKQKVLAPLMEVLASYKMAHDKFFLDMKGLTEKDCDDTYKNSLWGQLEHRLRRLESRQWLLGFASSRYDNVMLVSNLVSILKEKYNTSPRLIRKGTSVRSITIPSHALSFVDIQNLLAPGYSLQKFSIITGIANEEVKKFSFPFKEFTSLDYLESNHLPSTTSSYYNAFKNLTPTQDEVDELIEFYNKKGFKNVGEYLTYYLKW